MTAIEDTIDRDLRAALARADADEQAERAREVFRERAIEGASIDATLTSLATEADRFLGGTKDLAREAVAWERRRCPGVPARGRLADHDLLRIARTPALDGAFRAARAVPVVDETLQAMRTTARAAVAPGDGLPVWRAVLAAAGTAIVPDPALAALLEGLVVQPIWLERRVEIARSDVDAVRRTAATARLLDARRAAALLGWEVSLRRGIDDPPAAFQSLLGDAMDADWLPGRWAADLDPACADRVRGLLAEPMLLVAVRDRFDEDWFANPRTGPALSDAARTIRPEDVRADALVRRSEELLA